MKKTTAFYLLLLTLVLIISVASCSKNSSQPNTFTIAYSNLKPSSRNITPALDTSIKGHAYAILNIMSDSIMSYDIFCDTIPAGDTPNSFSLYFGLSGQNGTLIQTVPITLNSKGEAISNIKLPANIVDSFISYGSLYFVINSAAHPNGLMRAQISHAGVIGHIKNSKPNVYAWVPLNNNKGFAPWNIFQCRADRLVFTDQKRLVPKNNQRFTYT